MSKGHDGQYRQLMGRPSRFPLARSTRQSEQNDAYFEELMKNVNKRHPRPTDQKLIKVKDKKPRKPKRTCECPIYCKYCGRHRSKDSVGHYCKTRNCQWQHGYSTCQ